MPTLLSLAAWKAFVMTTDTVRWRYTCHCGNSPVSMLPGGTFDLSLGWPWWSQLAKMIGYIQSVTQSGFHPAHLLWMKLWSLVPPAQSSYLHPEWGCSWWWWPRPWPPCRSPLPSRWTLKLPRRWRPLPPRRTLPTGRSAWTGSRRSWWCWETCTHPAPRQHRSGPSAWKSRLCSARCKHTLRKYITNNILPSR